MNLIILAVVFIGHGKYFFNIGSIFNLVLVGIVIDFLSDPFGIITSLTADNPVVGILFFMASVTVFVVGVALYLNLNFDDSPYDSVAPLLSERTGWKYTPIRVVQDVIVLIAAWAIGGFTSLGVFTLIAAFGTGPLVSFCSLHIVKPLYAKLHVLTDQEATDIFESYTKKHKKSEKEDGGKTHHHTGIHAVA